MGHVDFWIVQKVMTLNHGQNAYAVTGNQVICYFQHSADVSLTNLLVIDRMLGRLGGAPLCPCCEKRVYFNEEKNFAGKKWHKSCFICSMTSRCFFQMDFMLYSDNVIVNGATEIIY